MGGGGEFEGRSVHSEEVEEGERGEVEGDGFDGEGVVDEIGGGVEETEGRRELGEERSAGYVVEDGTGSSCKTENEGGNNERERKSESDASREELTQTAKEKRSTEPGKKNLSVSIETTFNSTCPPSFSLSTPSSIFALTAQPGR